MKTGYKESKVNEEEIMEKMRIILATVLYLKRKAKESNIEMGYYVI